jgi:hypothetical protein
MDLPVFHGRTDIDKVDLSAVLEKLRKLGR